jgi:GR25 family glycosyltransferase involved in LPS biosynthesis
MPHIVVVIFIVIGILLYVLYYRLKYLTIQTEVYTNVSKPWDSLISDTYYINLDRSPDRKVYMEDILSKANIPYKRFTAVEGKTKTNICKQLKVTPGALGCKLSHIEILKKVKKDGWTIVFEDDILFDNPSNVKNDILNCISSLPEDAELVLFGTSPRLLYLYLLLNRFEPHKNNIWKTNSNLTCAHAYAITYNGAQKWIKEIEKYMCEKPFDMHPKGIDTIYLYTKKIDNHKSSISILSQILKLKDMCYIEQNKSKFGYFDSLVTFS